MPYLILVLALIVGLYALYRFFITAQAETIRTFIRICITIAYAVAMLFFAMTGRIFVSIGLALLGIPFAYSYIVQKRKTPKIDAEESEQHDKTDEE